MSVNFAIIIKGNMGKQRPIFSEAECYEKIYGSLILYVDHYKMKLNTNPGAVNLMPDYLSKHLYISEERF